MISKAPARLALTFALAFAGAASAQGDGGIVIPLPPPPAVDAGVAAPDAGAAAAHAADAGTSSGPDAGQGALPVSDGKGPPGFAARVHDLPSPLVFRIALGSKDARTRALEAGAAITSALESSADGEGAGATLDAGPAEVDARAAASVTVVPNIDMAVVRVYGHTVATLAGADARAEGAGSLDAYADEMETRLTGFVQQEARRSSLQSLAFHVFLSVVLALLALLTMRALRTAFARFERTLEERQTLKPLSLVSVQVLSGEAVRGLLLVGLFVGRILAYLIIAVAALLSVLSQFESTRPWVSRISTWALSPVVTGAEALVRAVPGLLLGAGLVVAALAAIRFVGLWLQGIGTGNVTSSRIEQRQAWPARVVISAVIGLVAAPLAVAAAFSRFGTPLEAITIAVAGTALLASVPTIASAVVGIVVLWRGALRAGDWVAIGGPRGWVRGEVSSLHVLDIVLVPPEGGTVLVPMLTLATSQVRRETRAPFVEVAARVKRDRPVADVEKALEKLARGVDESGAVSLRAIGETYVDVTVRVACTKAHGRDLLVRALASASERGDIALLDAPGGLPTPAGPFAAPLSWSRD